MNSNTALSKFLWLAATMCLLVASTARGADEIVYFHTDALGSATAAFNENGNLCWKQSYTPYGGQTSDADRAPPAGCGLIGKDRGYTGHVQDESGLTYMQQRYYDASIGRFLSIDPASVQPDDPRTYNRYMYANNNPYNYVDPDGEFAQHIVGAGLGVVLGGVIRGVTGGDVFDASAIAADAATGALGVGIANKVATLIHGVRSAKASRTLASATGQKVGAESTKGGGNNLFRVVDDVELSDIQKTGAFRSPAGTLEEGKQFVDNIGDAKALQSQFSRFFGGNQSIVGAKAPQSVINNSTKQPFADIPKGQAITVPSKDLPRVKPDI